MVVVVLVATSPWWRRRGANASVSVVGDSGRRTVVAFAVWASSRVAALLSAVAFDQRASYRVSRASRLAVGYSFSSLRVSFTHLTRLTRPRWIASRPYALTVSRAVARAGARTVAVTIAVTGARVVAVLDRDLAVARADQRIPVPDLAALALALAGALALADAIAVAVTGVVGASLGADAVGAFVALHVAGTDSFELDHVLQHVVDQVLVHDLEWFTPVTEKSA